MELETCILKRCQGKFGCLCPKRDGKGFYGKPTQKLPKTRTLQIDNISQTRIRSSKAHAKDGGGIKSSNSKRSNEFKLSENKTHHDDVHTSEIVEKFYGNGESGEVVICFNHYKKKFSIINGSLGSSVIDAEYCITFAYPKCKIHLSEFKATDSSLEGTLRPLIVENPIGIFHGLLCDKVYYVDVEEDSDENEAYMKRQEQYAIKNMMKRTEQADDLGHANLISERMESCSCVEGNPCMDSYCCKDWEKRFLIAKAHGWKGYS